ncbi:MAG: serine protease [Planctomycetes bacterium]|nr:serine protease [Planctomycetota bacterium]
MTMKTNWLAFVFSLVSLVPFCFADQRLAELFKRVEPSVVVLQSDAGVMGSGFVVDKDLIATNHHVIEGCGKLTVCFADGTSVESPGVHYLGEKRDLAIIKAQVPATVKPLPIQAKLPVVGEDVAAIGHSEGFRFSMSDGIVGGIRTGAAFDQPREGTWIQTGAAISKGNSGGPLLALMSGEVVGINTLTRVGQDKTAQNLNFAISCVDLAAAVTTAKALPLQTYRQAFPPKMKTQVNLDAADDQLTPAERVTQRARQKAYAKKIAREWALFSQRFVIRQNVPIYSGTYVVGWRVVVTPNHAALREYKRQLDYMAWNAMTDQQKRDLALFTIAHNTGVIAGNTRQIADQLKRDAIDRMVNETWGRW